MSSQKHFLHKITENVAQVMAERESCMVSVLHGPRSPTESRVQDRAVSTCFLSLSVMLQQTMPYRTHYIVVEGLQKVLRSPPFHSKNCRLLRLKGGLLKNFYNPLFPRTHQKSLRHRLHSQKEQNRFWLWSRMQT